MMRIVFTVLTFAIGSQIGMASLRAQLHVELKFQRAMFILFEPIIATVRIENRSGRELLLACADEIPWLAFRIQNSHGYAVPLRQARYSVSAVTLQPGETVEREINLTPTYMLEAVGSFRIYARVFVSDCRQYFSSAACLFELTDGRQVKQQTIGSAVDGSLREVTLLTHRHPTYTALYLRVKDPDKQRIYCTHPLGRIITFGEPELAFDCFNTIHVLHRRAPKEYVYSHIGMNGEILKRAAYLQMETQPILEAEADGKIRVAGGEIYEPNKTSSRMHVSKVSYRPVPLPMTDDR